MLVRKGTGHPIPSAESPGPALWVMVTADRAGRASDQTAPPRWETKVPGVSVLSTDGSFCKHICNCCHATISDLRLRKQ